SGVAENGAKVAASPFSPFSGRRCRQADEGRRRPQARCRYPEIRSITAPQPDSFSSSRSKPRSR
ncbi:MAG: hypothetical protein EOR53_34810, partial [Mesorhizobium sp.]